MKYVRASSLFHGGAVNSLHIDHGGTKVVTAGKDCIINVWSFSQFTDVCHQQELSLSQVEQIQPISQFSFHKSPVDLVRWSPISSTLFASSDESGHLYLTDTETGPKQVFPFNSYEPIPIIDFSWSKNGQLIAWSTLDGQVHIYDIIKKTYQVLTKLTHSPKLLVQRSLAFDPTNNYLVTVGDDTMIYVYQYTCEESGYQFRLINKISKFVSQNETNIRYKRIGWSPDGELFSVPTVSKNQTNLISLISKSKSWENRIGLVGHGFACEVVDFNPKIYQNSVDELDPNQMDNIFNIVATAGSDRTLAIWNTSKDTPIFIVKELVDKPIVDLSWDPTGQYLMLAALDGHIGVVSFDELELGKEVSQTIRDQLNKFQQDLIKPLNFKYVQDQPTTGRKLNQPAIELLDQKDAIDTLKEEPVDTTDLNKPVESLANTETVVVKELPQIGDIVPEVPSADLPDEKQVDILHSAMNTRKSKIKTTKPAPAKENVEQKITTKNGKRRIQPLLISNSNANNGGAQKENGTMNELSTSTVSMGNTNKSLMEYDKPSYAVSDEFQKQVKRSKGEDGTTNKKLKRELEPVKFVGSVILNPNTAFAKVRLAVPKVRMGFQITNKQDDDTYILDIKNGIGNETKPSRITYFKKEKQIWTDFIPRYVQLAVSGDKFWAVSTIDGQILTYSHFSGARLLPPFVLGSPISFLESHGPYLMAVTCVGEVFVWDLEAKKIKLSANISPLLELSSKYQDDGLNKSDNITMCSITSSGIPLITLSNGSGYLYNGDLETWQTITESWWSFGSHYWDSTEDNKSISSSLHDGEISIIQLLEHKTNEEITRKNRTGRGKYFNKISKNMIMKEGFENIENTISLSHLENRILCCELLGDFKDFHANFITYATRLCELGMKTKLYEICDQLLGPGDDVIETQPAWEPSICGYEKHALLKEVIYACSKHRDAQRILIHFSKKLGIVDSDVHMDLIVA